MSYTHRTVATNIETELVLAQKLAQVTASVHATSNHGYSVVLKRKVW
jgi:hypothetical protein